MMSAPQPASHEPAGPSTVEQVTGPSTVEHEGTGPSSVEREGTTGSSTVEDGTVSAPATRDDAARRSADEPRAATAKPRQAKAAEPRTERAPATKKPATARKTDAAKPAAARKTDAAKAAAAGKTDAAKPATRKTSSTKPAPAGKPRAAQPVTAGDTTKSAAAATPGAGQRPTRRKAPAWPAPVPQATPEELKARSHGTGPAPARRRSDRPRPVATEPAAPALPRLEGTPISLAGADTPAMLLPRTLSALAPTRSTPAVLPEPDRPAAPDPAARAALTALTAPVPQAPVPSAAPLAATTPPAPTSRAAPAAPGASSPPPGMAPTSAPTASSAAADPTSKAPPGFAAAGIRAAESPTLLALDPVTDETTAAVPAAVAGSAPTETIGGSALLPRFLAALPRRADLRRVGRDAAATRRVALTAVAAILLVLLLGPPLVRAGKDVPLLGAMIRQLEALTLYPAAYGIPWIIAALGTIAAAGVVVAQMETTAHKQERREDPAVRLNIALAGLVTLTLAAAALALGRSVGWAAGGAFFGFLLSTCLLIPAWNLPGARAMAQQPARAWALLFGLSLVGFLIAPGFPLAAVAIVSGRQVRRRWAAIRRGDDDGTDGPIDATNRLSALVIVGFVVIVAAIGMRASAVPPSALRGTEFDNPTVLPGTERGPTIAPPESR